MSRPAAILGGAGGIVVSAICISTAVWFGNKGFTIMVKSGKDIIFGVTGVKV